jgi:hypothetical protein
MPIQQKTTPTQRPTITCPPRAASAGLGTGAGTHGKAV